jgi:hypothetical protein
VGLRDIQSSLPDPSEGIFGEDINDASLNLGAGAFIIRINIMSLFNRCNLPIWIIMGENTVLMYRIIS